MLHVTVRDIVTIKIQKHAQSSAFAKYRSLFPGIEFGAAYKVLQRMYKFGGQPFVNTFILNNYERNFKEIFGHHSKTMVYAVAGSIMGVGEIVLLPLDVLKIKAQTNPDAFKGRGFLKIFMDEGTNLYRYWIYFVVVLADKQYAVQFIYWRMHMLQSFHRAC
jgi:hypothetical protein